MLLSSMRGACGYKIRSGVMCACECAGVYRRTSTLLLNLRDGLWHRCWRWSRFRSRWRRWGRRWGRLGSRLGSRRGCPRGCWRGCCWRGLRLRYWLRHSSSSSSSSSSGSGCCSCSLVLSLSVGLCCFLFRCFLFPRLFLCGFPFLNRIARSCDGELLARLCLQLTLHRLLTLTLAILPGLFLACAGRVRAAGPSELQPTLQ